MSTNIKYVSSRGNEYDLTAGYIHTTRDSDFHEYAWKADTTSLRYGDRVNQFQKEALELDAELIFKGKHEVIDSLIDKLRDEFEYDIKNQKIGRIYWNDWYISAYITESSTNEYGRNYLRNKIKIYAPYPFWVRERVYEIEPGTEEEEAEGEENKTYDYTYSYVYGKRSIKTVNIESSGSVNFKLVVFGSFSTLNLAIGNHVFRVSASASEGEYMVIDSRDYLDYEKRCYIQRTGGSVDNVFDYRDPKYELFKELEEGRHVIAYHGSGKIELTVYEERSEAAWTERSY